MTSPSPRRSRRAAALQFTALAAAVIAGTVAGALSFSSAPSSSLPPAYSTFPPPAMEVVDPAELEVALRRVGLSPETLAASGLTGQETATLIANARTHLDEHLQALNTAEASHFAAEAAHEALKRRVQSGLATQADLANFQTAATSLSSAGSARTAAYTGLYNAAVEGLGSGKLQMLATLKGNAAWEVPLQYLADNRSEEQWVALRNALANATIAQRYGESSSPEASQIILSAQAGAGTSAANAGLQSLATIQNAWDAAVTP